MRYCSVYCWASDRRHRLYRKRRAIRPGKWSVDLDELRPIDRQASVAPSRIRQSPAKGPSTVAAEWLNVDGWEPIAATKAPMSFGD